MQDWAHAFMAERKTGWAAPWEVEFLNARIEQYRVERLDWRAKAKELAEEVNRLREAAGEPYVAKTGPILSDAAPDEAERPLTWQGPDAARTGYSTEREVGTVEDWGRESAGGVEARCKEGLGERGGRGLSSPRDGPDWHSFLSACWSLGCEVHRS
jgi:hypothetical protein